MNESLKSQITEHCQMVQRGVKPLSLLSHQERYHDEIVNEINKHNLHYSSELNGDGWRTIYIYKNKIVCFLIPELPQKPTKPSEHALLGLLLGYDINSICDYILDKCELDEHNSIPRVSQKRELLIAFHKFQQNMWSSPNAEITENVVDVFLKSNV